MKKILCLTLATLFCPTVLAEGTVNVVGSGNNSCGTWMKDRKTTSDWHQAGQWINGYYVAAQELLSKDLSLKKVDTYALAAFVDKYCSDNPLDSVFDDTLPLLKELVQKKN
ncbi:MAG: hypothetical protein WC247_02040 [Porticoccaceae bacterium]